MTLSELIENLISIQNDRDEDLGYFDVVISDKAGDLIGIKEVAADYGCELIVMEIKE